MDASPSVFAPSSTANVRDIEEPYLGRWSRLVSTTNWEKGRIIQEWRTAMSVAGAPITEYSDEVWSERVGGVTSQHVGRLRRVHERFSSVQDKYVGLFWSHFQAALDWNDAEMWLEGAVQNAWSVAAMRRTRSETLGQITGNSAAVDEPSTDMDEDYVSTPELEGPEQEGAVRGEPDTRDSAGFDDRISGPPIPEGPDFGDEQASGDRQLSPSLGEQHEGASVPMTVQPFANLVDLPADFADAFDTMKLALLRHKTEGWQQISCADALAALDALKELACAPSPETAPF